MWAAAVHVWLAFGHQRRMSGRKRPRMCTQGSRKCTLKLSSGWNEAPDPRGHAGTGHSQGRGPGAGWVLQAHVGAGWSAGGAAGAAGGQALGRCWGAGGERGGRGRVPRLLSGSVLGAL